MAASGLRIAAWERDVNSAELVDLKALADRFDPAESFEECLQGIRLDPVDLEVDVRRLAAHEPITHPAADDERAAAGVTDSGGDGGNDRVHRSAEAFALLAGLRPNFFTKPSVKPGANALSHTSPRDFA